MPVMLSLTLKIRSNSLKLGIPCAHKDIIMITSQQHRFMVPLTSMVHNRWFTYHKQNFINQSSIFSCFSHSVLQRARITANSCAHANLHDVIWRPCMCYKYLRWYLWFALLSMSVDNENNDISDILKCKIQQNT